MNDHFTLEAGSAINSIKNAQGKADPKLGAEAMRQALEVFQSGELRDVLDVQHVKALAAVAERRRLVALRVAYAADIQRWSGDTGLNLSCVVNAFLKERVS